VVGGVTGAIAGDVAVDWDCTGLVFFLEFVIWMAVPVSSKRRSPYAAKRRASLPLTR